MDFNQWKWVFYSSHRLYIFHEFSNPIHNSNPLYLILQGLISIFLHNEGMFYFRRPINWENIRLAVATSWNFLYLQAIFGVLQGSGSAPAIWLAVSLVLIETYVKKFPFHAIHHFLKPRLSSNTPFLPCEEGTHYHRGNHEDHVECLIAERVLGKFWYETAIESERKNIENSCASLLPDMKIAQIHYIFRTKLRSWIQHLLI